jgi:hypothetical protein
MGRAEEIDYGLPAKERVLLQSKEHALGEDIEVVKRKGHMEEVAACEIFVCTELVLNGTCEIPCGQNSVFERGVWELVAIH